MMCRDSKSIRCIIVATAIRGNLAKAAVTKATIELIPPELLANRLSRVLVRLCSELLNGVLGVPVYLQLNESLYGVSNLAQQLLDEIFRVHLGLTLLSEVLDPFVGLLVQVGLVLAEELKVLGEGFLEVVLLLLGFVAELLQFEGDAAL